jgi:phage tail-like protein
MTTRLLAPAFRFTVSFAPSPTADSKDRSSQVLSGGFTEVTGLDVEMETAELAQGGRNNAVVQRAGRAKVSRLTLRRGMMYEPGGTVEPAFWGWLADSVSGVFPLRRYDVTVQVMSAGSAVATWAARRALPAKIVGPQLNARTGEVLIEELQLAHEGLRLVFR